jgi:hypothetical protein
VHHNTKINNTDTESKHFLEKAAAAAAAYIIKELLSDTGPEIEKRKMMPLSERERNTQFKRRGV